VRRVLLGFLAGLAVGYAFAAWYRGAEVITDLVLPPGYKLG
jgi:hypothetical protein